MEADAENDRSEVQAALCETVGCFGTEVLSDSRRRAALLHDLCPRAKGPVFAVVAASSSGVASEIVSVDSNRMALVRSGLRTRLVDECMLSNEAADWAIGAVAAVARHQLSAQAGRVAVADQNAESASARPQPERKSQPRDSDVRVEEARTSSKSPEAMRVALVEDLHRRRSDIISRFRY